MTPDKGKTIDAEAGPGGTWTPANLSSPGVPGDVGPAEVSSLLLLEAQREYEEA